MVNLKQSSLVAVSTSMSSRLELPKTELHIPTGLEAIILGGGCFWCTEAVFSRLQGVRQVISGYSGGIVDHPSYQQICTGTTGHAEVILVYFDPQIISLTSLLEVFWSTHDPTTLNRQGADHGPQYRSVIFYLDERQEQHARQHKEALDESGKFSAPVVTEISPFTNFYPAEGYHQQYFERHSTQAYCQFVILPKVEKLHTLFADKLKT